jgi:hypothetical protein
MKSLKRIRNRKHRCYELCIKVMFEEPGAEKFRLAHGRLYGGLGHAWIELPGGRIYDAVKDRYFESLADFRNNQPGAIVDYRYTQKQMAKQMLKHGHMGPWPTRPEHAPLGF